MNKNILSNLIITDYKFSTTMYTEQGKSTLRESRPLWAVVIKYEGETVYTSIGKRYLSDKNNIVILPKGCSYTWNCTKEGHFSIIEFESDTVCDEIFSFQVKNGEEFLKIFKVLETKNLIKIECIKEVYGIILKLLHTLENNYTPSDKQRKIAPAISYIAENYHTDIRNDDLAKICSLSTVYFRKLFTQITGLSPVSYVRSVRIKKAKEMLKSDYRNITDIALSLGYKSIYDFSRDFKKSEGISPSKY